jgi:periplasmic protein TonB
MTAQARAFQISFLLHSVVIALAVMCGAFQNQCRKTIVLDFHLPPPATVVQKHEAAAPMPVIAAKPVKPAGRSDRKEKEAPPQIKESPRMSLVPETPPIVKLPEAPSLKSGPATRLEDTGKSAWEGAPGIAGGTRAGNGKSSRAGDTDSGKESARAHYLNEHFAYIRDKILRNVIYPDSARRMGWQGRVLLSFVVTANGSVRECRVVKSSGFLMLDQNALETVKDTAPFPTPPVEARLVVPIVYRLE